MLPAYIQNGHVAAVAVRDLIVSILGARIVDLLVRAVDLRVPSVHLGASPVSGVDRPPLANRPLVKTTRHQPRRARTREKGGPDALSRTETGQIANRPGRAGVPSASPLGLVGRGNGRAVFFTGSVLPFLCRFRRRFSAGSGAVSFPVPAPIPFPVPCFCRLRPPFLYRFHFQEALFRNR